MSNPTCPTCGHEYNPYGAQLNFFPACGFVCCNSVGSIKGAPGCGSLGKGGPARRVVPELPQRYTGGTSALALSVLRSPRPVRRTDFPRYWTDTRTRQKFVAPRLSSAGFHGRRLVPGPSLADAPPRLR